MNNDTETLAADIPTEVRKKIISAGGLVGEDPADMDDADLLVADYHFTDAKFDLLCIKVQQLIDSLGSAARIGCDDVSACLSVKDCVKLVTDTLAGA